MFFTQQYAQATTLMLEYPSVPLGLMRSMFRSSTPANVVMEPPSLIFQTCGVCAAE
jgi:hypothetical protein